jgi:serine O-acetyltransferase
MLRRNSSSIRNDRNSYNDNNYPIRQRHQQQQGPQRKYYSNNYEPPYPKAFYPDIDLSIPDSVYSDANGIDLVWDLLRYEAYQNQLQQHEPLLVSFLHSTILNHDTLESSLAFLLANRLQSPAMMISTQLQALILSTLQDCPEFRKKLRADIMAVRDRDPACHTLPDVFLYFKGFHALQSYRTAHVLWNTGRTVLAQYLQSQVSQIFQIDIHPNATIGSGIMLDHGTGIVIGETVRI